LQDRGAEYTTKPADVTILKENSRESRVKITIIEGKNRQVRKMFLALGFKVRSLKRTHIGAFPLGSLPSGECTKLSVQELKLVAQGSTTLAEFIKKVLTRKRGI
jgi:16S rRNA U516 pseudouridylate synthase RsuA-like enzyme